MYETTGEEKNENNSPCNTPLTPPPPQKNPKKQKNPKPLHTFSGFFSSLFTMAFENYSEYRILLIQSSSCLKFKF